MADNQQPATKQDLEVLRKELGNELRNELASKRDVESLRKDVRQDIELVRRDTDTLRIELLAAIERSENNLLTAFHSWARTYEVRARGTSTLVAGFEERLSLAEERLNRLERGERAH